MTTVVILSNRRDLYVHDAIASAREHLSGATRIVVVDDTGDPAWRDHLAATERLVVQPVADQPAGYTAAMRHIWSLYATTRARIFFLEEDFTFTRDVDLVFLHAILDAYPRLAQIALQREPWYGNEHRAGVLRAQRERVNRERRAAGRPATAWTDHADFVEHNAGFTGNPSLISAAALAVDWPNVEWSETAMGDQLIHAGMTFGWYGRHGATPHTRHNGRHRADHSHGY